MPENEKPKLSAELLHQLLGEHVEKAGQTLRRHERNRLVIGASVVIGISAAISLTLVFTGFLGGSPLSVDYFVLLTFLSVGAAVWCWVIFTDTHVIKDDLELSAWQLRRIYELASRYEDTGPEIEPALRIGIVLKLGEAQLLLFQLRKFEAKDGRFEHMRSLGPDPLKVQTREEVRSSPTTGLATTERVV